MSLVLEKHLLKKLHTTLIEQQLSISTAESCTSGLLAYHLTHLSGSSAYYLGGVCVYSNTLKKDFCGVSDTSLKEFGAVSRQVAQELATGIKKRTGSDLAVSITGIAGPQGARPGKPVGTVWIGVSGQDSTSTHKLELSGTREEIRCKTVVRVLNLIFEEVLRVS